VRLKSSQIEHSQKKRYRTQNWEAPTGYRAAWTVQISEWKRYRRSRCYTNKASRMGESLTWRAVQEIFRVWRGRHGLGRSPPDE
jgi:hypothetical protein